MQEMWVWSLGQKDVLQEKMATHSSILAWRTPCLRSLAGYSPWGGKRVGHGLVTEQQLLDTTVSHKWAMVLVPTVSEMPPLGFESDDGMMTWIPMEEIKSRFHCHMVLIIQNDREYQDKIWPVSLIHSGKPIKETQLQSTIAYDPLQYICIDILSSPTKSSETWVAYLGDRFLYFLQ